MDSLIQPKWTYALIPIGILLGLVLYFSPGSLFIMLLAMLAVCLIRRISEVEARTFLLKLFLIAFSARIVATLLMSIFTIISGNILNYHVSHSLPNYSTPDFIDDSGYYTLRSQFLSMYWLGEPLSEYTISVATYPYGFTGFTHVLASYFTLFGYSPVSSRFINCFLGVLNAILVYYIASYIFDKKTARLAAVLTAFFPSLFLWSITNLKDTSFAFAIYLMIWSFIKFQKTKKFYYLFLLFCSYVYI